MNRRSFISTVTGGIGLLYGFGKSKSQEAVPSVQLTHSCSGWLYQNTNSCFTIGDGKVIWTRSGTAFLRGGGLVEITAVPAGYTRIRSSYYTKDGTTLHWKTVDRRKI